MQRRAAAVYAVFLLLVAVGAYALIGAAQEPAVTIRDPEASLSVNDTLTVDGREYTVSEISAGTNEGDDLRSAELAWVNDSARHTETLDNGSTATIGGTTFEVRTRPGTSPPSVALTEARELGENVTTTEIQGTTYVVLGTGDNRTLVSRDRYLRQQRGPPETRQIAAGEQFEYDNRTVTLDAVSNESATVAWRAPQENTVSVEEGGNVTLGNTQYVGHFPDNATLELSTDVTGYVEQRRVIDRYHERISGLWGVTILSGLAAILMLGLAYLPSRY